MNKEELNCYHKIFTIIRKTDLLNLDEKDELHLFLMKFKDENKELKSLYETQTNFNKELLNKFSKKDRVLKELRSWLEEMIDDENDIFSVVRVRDILIMLNELEGKNE